MPATADAGRKPFGSALSATPNHIESEGVDSAYWSSNLPGGRAFKVPTKSKVGTIKIKGNIAGNQGPNVVHFQILHPIGNGRMKVILTSGNNKLPRGGDPNQVTTYHPINLCARKGDYVALSVIGGGTRFRTFSNVPGAATKAFTGAGGDNNGDTFTGRKLGGVELMMRMIAWTGPGKSGAGICNSYNPSSRLAR
ncbi:MAG TPA: hypothetical protein VJT75_14140 [Thermoleophilaceae bacterium]|nr:hypothetical protein [Thermoleophilaceae bacterium]